MSVYECVDMSVCAFVCLSVCLCLCMCLNNLKKKTALGLQNCFPFGKVLEMVPQDTHTQGKTIYY